MVFPNSHFFRSSGAAPWAIGCWGGQYHAQGPIKFVPGVADRVIKAESVFVVCFYVDRLVILKLHLRGRLMEMHQNGKALGTAIVYQKALSQAHLPEELSQSKRKVLVF